jgi:hypothetical protein
VTLKPIATLVAWILLASQAQAVPEGIPTVSNPRVVPNPAIAGAPVAYRIQLYCGSAQPPVIAREGSIVTVRQTYSSVCGLPPPPVDVDFALGTFAEGQYTLVYISRNLVPGSTDDAPILVPFGVVAPTGVPTQTRLALAFLIASILLLAACRHRLRAS